LHRQGQLKKAERIYRSVLKKNPHQADAWFLLGVLNYQRDDFAAAAADLKRATDLAPDHADAHNNLGLALIELGRADKALVALEHALGLRPTYSEAHNNRGNALRAMGRLPEAIESYRSAIAIAPDFAQAHFNLGIALAECGRSAEAAASYRRVVALDPSDAEAHCNLGSALAKLGQQNEAAASFRWALAINPHLSEAHYNLANALSSQRRLEEAITHYRRAIEIKSDYREAYENLAITLVEIGRFRETIATATKLLAIDRKRRGVLSPLGFAQLGICDWINAGKTLAEMKDHIAGGGLVEPFVALAFGLSPQEQLVCAQRSIAANTTTAAPLPLRSVPRDGKIRLAYISPDFRDHPVAAAAVELFERHDRNEFEVSAISYGGDDGSSLRKRIIKAFDQFHEVGRDRDEVIADRLRDSGIDILVDLGGHTRGTRSGILARRPAPVQVNYLGFAGTMGADFIDYVIADDVALPFDQQPFFTERIVHLPGSFFATDSTREISVETPSRIEAGLPEHGFVFCSFNQSYKLSGHVFEIWMRLLQAVDGSVLWLHRLNDDAQANLRREAGRFRVNPERLVFASRVGSVADHLARHRLADLFLDTLPYNAHSTAADALWAGLPVLTCKENNFAGRIAASLVTAAGLQEMATNSLAEYESKALELASQPEALARLRQKLRSKRTALPLFDTDRFRRHLEDAYRHMLECSRRGEAPQRFSVPYCD
ncbi:MAG: tetratricopeptide repeat protein, partial [Deltaproteobacteria bacterium]|nr:tetratricopeptide repeat protein [Deltaproteobacteria bacterium]